MSRKQSAEPSSFKVQGFIEVEKISQGGRVKETYKCNTITPGGKQMIIARSMGLLLGLGPNVYGDLYTADPLQISRDGYRLVRDDQVITNTLLNLSASELSGLGPNSKSVNIWNSDFNSQSKVVGFANMNLTPYDLNKEGKVDYCKASYMTDNKVICKRWHYPQGVATGTINTIAMMPASCLKYKAGQGLRVSRMLDRINFEDANFGHLTTAFCPPGMPGMTSSQEILLNYSQNNISKHKFNFVTGEMTDITDENTPFFCPISVDGSDTYLPLDMYFDSSKNVLYFACLNNSNSRIYFSAWKFNSNGTYEVLNNKNRYVSGNNTGGRFFINSNNELCFSYSNRSATKLDTSSDGTITGNTPYSNGLEDILGTIPSGLADDTIYLGMYNGSYVLYIENKLPESIRSSTYLNAFQYNLGYTGYQFNSLSDFAGTITDIITGIGNYAVPFKASTYAGYLELGFNFAHSDSYEYMWANAMNIFNGYQDVANPTNDSKKNNSASVSYQGTSKVLAGLWYTPDGAWGNMVSFAKLDTAITKGDTDELYVSYGYQIL